MTVRRDRLKQLSLLLPTVISVASGQVSAATTQNASTYKALNQCGVPVVLPSTLPAGFRQTSFDVSLCRDSCRFQSIPCRRAPSSYSVTYKGPNRCTIIHVGMVGGMFGEGPPPRTWTTQTALFGPMTITESYDKTYLAGLSTSWDREGRQSTWNKQYHHAFPHAQFKHEFTCVGRAFNPDTALAFLRSLRVVAAA